jgi:type I restriction enzyme S subunit
MSFPRYPAYKPSGVEWLGEVSEHWEVKPLKRVAEIQTGLAKGKEVEPGESVDVPFLRVANVQDGFLDLVQVHTIRIPESSLERYLLRSGDVLMNEGGDFDKLGRGCVWDCAINLCIHQNHVFAVRPYSIRPSWLNVYTSSLQANSYFISRSKQSTNLASISSSNLMDLLVPIAPDLETKQILDFLGHETAKIDALIAEQQRLIELLQEKRQAVISHAVTKGLNPDAPMKDSGVEWLGKVPEHWEVGQLRRFTKTVRTGRTPDESDFIEHDDFIPWFTPGSFNDATLTLETVKHVSIESVNEGRASIFSKDAVLVVGIGATLGKVGIPGDACSGNQQINAIESSGKLMPRFLGLFLSAAQELMRISSNATTIGIMNQQKTKELVVNCPHLVEQEQIVFHTEKALRGMLEMSEQCQRVVELLQERCSALIIAAVTGQIDVRGLVPEAVAA